MTLTKFHAKSKAVKKLNIIRRKASKSQYVYNENIKNCETLLLYHNFLKSSNLSAEDSVKAIETNLTRIAKFLCYSFFVENMVRILTSQVKKWIFTIFKSKLFTIDNYCTHLVDTKSHAPATIYNFLGNVKKLFDWFSVSRTDYFSVYRISGPVTRRFEKTYDLMRKKQKALSADKQSRKTYEEAVKDRRLPAKGIEELQSYVLKHLAFVQAFNTNRKQNKPNIIDVSVFSLFMRILYAAIYIFAPNGRVGGIESLKFKDVESLLHSSATTTDFKTRMSYGLQAVLLGRVAKYIFKVYVWIFRPFVATIETSTPESSLWLTIHGTPELNIGSKVTQFFHSVGLHITTTSIRTLVETRTAVGFLNGTITAGQVAAINSVNGHSSQMAKTHYTLIETKRVAEIARGAMDLDRNTPDYVDQDLEGDSYEVGNTEYADWGSEHPMYQSDAKRIPFSTEENKYLTRLVQEHKREYGEEALPSTFTSRCLRKIKSDPNALKIFHLRHVLFPDRLRNGLQALGFVK